MFIADTGNCRVAMVPVSTGTYFTLPMSANDIYDLAGRNGTANCTIGNDSKIANMSNLSAPASVRDPNGNVYIADAGNNRIQEVAGTGHPEFGQTMTAGFVYTVAGDPNGSAGDSGDGGTAASALMNDPTSVWLDSAGDIYASDTGNNEIREISKTSPYHITDTAGNGYTLLTTGDGGPGGAVRPAQPGRGDRRPARRPVHRRHRQQPGPGDRRVQPQPVRHRR